MTGLRDVDLSFGKKIILERFSYTFAQGKITAVMGASGVGKTTLLRLLAGLLKPDAGKVFTDAPSAMLFQEPRLCPWLSVAENLSLVLNAKDGNIVSEWLAKVHLDGEEESMPNTLSGGMRQRLSLARTLAYVRERDCRLVLLDEPFKGLDIDLHSEMLELIRTNTEGRSVVLVTHDPEDAMLLAHECLTLGRS